MCHLVQSEREKKLKKPSFSLTFLLFHSSLSTIHFPTMSAEYGSVNPTDEEAPLLHTQVEPQTCWEKIKTKLHLHGHRVLISWIIVLSVTAVLTLSFHFALKGHHHSAPPADGDDLILECVSDRSWFVAAILAIFVGPFVSAS